MPPSAANINTHFNYVIIYTKHPIDIAIPTMLIVPSIFDLSEECIFMFRGISIFILSLSLISINAGADNEFLDSYR